MRCRTFRAAFRWGSDSGHRAEQTTILATHSGVENVSLTQANNPSHTHGALAAGRTVGDTGTAANHVWAHSAGSDNLYENLSTATAQHGRRRDHAERIEPTSHENLQPYLALNYIIALLRVSTRRGAERTASDPVEPRAAP